MPTIMKPWLKTLLLPHLYTLLLLVLITLPNSVMLVLNGKAGLLEALPLPFSPLLLWGLGGTTAWLKSTNEICQPLLANIDMLLMIAKKFPDDVYSRLPEKQIAEWKETFEDWFTRVNKKIPEKYRQKIYDDAATLFKRLEKYGNNFS